MRKMYVILSLIYIIFTYGCQNSVTQLECQSDETIVNGTCTTIPVDCSDDAVNINGTCRIKSALTITLPYHQLVSDYDEISKFIEDNNPKLYTNIEQMNRLKVEQRNHIKDHMTQLEFFRLLMPYVAAYDDGHTRIILPNAINDFFYYEHKIFPFETRVIDQKLYVIDNYSDIQIHEGSMIESINGMSVDQIFNEISLRYSSDGDNTTMLYSDMNQSFSYFYFIFIDEFATQYDVSYIDHMTGENKQDIFDGISYFDIIQEPWEYQPFSYEIIDQIGYLDINTFIAWNGVDEFYQFYHNTFQDLAEKNVVDIIIDVRDNGGGEPRVSADLLRYLLDEPQAYFSPDSPHSYYGLTDLLSENSPHFQGHIYVLMNGLSFSTTGHFLALLTNVDSVNFIGETPGGRSACSDSSDQYTGKYSNLTIQSSTAIWRVVVDHAIDGQPISPDYEVYMSVDDYLEERDSILQFAIDLIVQNREI